MMKKAVHFGAGNIGRGFIGEVLFANDFKITFVDVNDDIIEELNQRHCYEVKIADEKQDVISVENVKAINSRLNPEQVAMEIANADLVTTAIGSKVFPAVAPLIAQGITQRCEKQVSQPLDIIACENMIGGSQELKHEVEKYLSKDVQSCVDQYIGFPNAAVDRIVPIQHHDDILLVEVEPFKEWIVDKSQMKNKNLQLKGVDYVDDLEPYIERKLFSVNTGHATVAYTGSYLGYKTIIEALDDEKVLNQLEHVLEETGQLLIDKWHFDPETHHAYQKKIINRFKNKYISDDIARVGRTPIRKLGRNERFIRPIRETEERHLPNDYLIQTAAMIYKFHDINDDESEELQKMENESPIQDVIEKTTQLHDQHLIEEIKESFEVL